MGMTMAEKVLARCSGRDAVQAGAYVTAVPDRLMAHEAFGICALTLRRLGVSRLFDPERVVVVLDHYFPAPTEAMARAHKLVREIALRLGVRHFLGHAGICHQVLSEGGYVLPGALVLGTDSHSTTYGALGAAGAGIGLTEMSYVLATGELWMQVPATLRFELRGDPRPGILSKDVVLHLAGRFGTEVASYKAIEYGGPLVSRMSVASRMTMANMGVELGAKFAFFEADETALAFLEGRRPAGAEAAALETAETGGGDAADPGGEGVADAGGPAGPGGRPDPRGATPLGPEPVRFGPDPDAVYEAVHDVDVSGLEPQVACPHNPGNVRPVSDVAGRRVDQAFLGSCTNARLEDLAVAAAILDGRRVHPQTRFLVTPASHQVHLEATRAGYVETLLAAGAHVTASGCGACPGGHQGVIGPGEVCVSSTNRNFRGRMGSPEAEVYLGSPALVAAAAVAGRIVDPREYWEGSGVGWGICQP